MEQRSIDLVPLFKFSFNQFKKYASFVIGATLTYYVLAIIPQIYFVLRAPETPTTESQIFQIILMMVQVFLSLGFTKIILLLAQDKFVEVADMFNNFRLFLNYFVASFLYGMGVFVGLFLLVIPGIFIAIRLQFYPYFIIEEGDASIRALYKSYHLSQNLNFELLLLGIAVVTLNVLGVLFMGIGIIITYPLTTLATAIVYKSLIDQSETIPSDQYRI